MKVTILKMTKGVETARLVEIEQVAEALRTMRYEKEVNDLRAIYPWSYFARHDDGTTEGANNYTRYIPRVCFATQMVNRNRQRVRLGYMGLVLLEVNNLTDYDEAAAIRRGAAQLPHTLLAFVGASGHSVKIVCPGRLPGKVPLPTTDDDIRRFHLNLYEKARLAYNMQLGVTVEKLEPGLQRTCYMSIDPDACYNPDAIPLYADMGDLRRAVVVKRTADTESDELSPGLDRQLTVHHIYHFCLARAYDDLAGISQDDPDFPALLLTALADYCCKSDIPQAAALRLTELRMPFRDDRQLVRLTFDNAYRKRSEGKYRSRKGINSRLRCVPPETLLTMRIDMFLRENYELRKNVMRGVAEYRHRLGLGFDFQDLTEEARNSMTLRALELGIKCWDKDIRRYVGSDDIELYDPIEDYLDRLPRWDRRDRIDALARRVPADDPQWPYLFHVWMRSMVAMWQGKGQSGNALVPLIIGRQGCGKSSFCRILLPRELREYYNDRINFKNEADLNLGLTSFALINLDEFDSVTQRQQIVLKYLVSTAELKYRPPYGKAYSAHRRYASFIGTTNELTPLVDPTGSRRFVCVEAKGIIDFLTPIDYQQVYAQLAEEISRGERYWLTKDEEQELQQANRRYQRVSGIGEMLASLCRQPSSADEGRWLTLRDISARLKEVFGAGYKEAPGTLEKIGHWMNRPEQKYPSRRMARGMEYRVVLL